MIKDIHSHKKAPYPEGIICVDACNEKDIENLKAFLAGPKMVEDEDFNTQNHQLYSIGVHPWSLADSHNNIGDCLPAWMIDVAEADYVAAIGECGIDIVKGGPLFIQMLMLREHAELAEKVGKPLILHCVKGQEQIIGMRKEMNATVPWIVHGFRGKATVARMLTDTGIGISFGDKFNPETLLSVPEEMVYAETDASNATIDEVLDALESVRHGVRDAILANTAKLFNN